MSSRSSITFFSSVLIFAGVIALHRHLNRKRQDLDKKRQELDSQTTFRVCLHSHRPEGSQKSETDLTEQTQQLVRKAFEVEQNVQILIRSIVIDSLTNKRVGTLNFSKIPDNIRQKRTAQHTLLSSEESPRMSVELDLGFLGLTQLSSGSLGLQALE